MSINKSDKIFSAEAIGKSRGTSTPFKTAQCVLIQAEILKNLFKVHTLWGERSIQSEVYYTACIIHKSFHKQQNKVFAYTLRVLKFWYSEEYLQKGKYFSSEVWSGEENPSSKEIGWIWQIQTSKTNKQTNRWRIAKYKLQKLHWKSTMVLSVSVTDLF